MRSGGVPTQSPGTGRGPAGWVRSEKFRTRVRSGTDARNRERSVAFALALIGARWAPNARTSPDREASEEGGDRLQTSTDRTEGRGRRNERS